ncbi:superoxide dismutase family protein [Virgibacillus doumboii]|uniref:superoxide dismutase family protein n=1 Tax=Virgibacillus doumboii TaxID=2697503 RepID=UPI0013E073E9|nr:superoxide dismutase family protein [Virgibacillus doumboii]
MKKWYVLIAIVAPVFALIGITKNIDTESTQRTAEQQPSVEALENVSEETTEVEVTLYNKDKEEVGTATIRQVHNGTSVALEASNLPPGTHGFHIHEKGVCEPPNFKSAGGHFNPTNAKHGFNHPEGPHAGDLPNIVANASGRVNTQGAADMVTLVKGKKNSLLGGDGTALIIHSKADDYKSQPSGAAGERIACGVIGE